MTKSMKNQSCLGKRAFPKKPNELVSIDFIVDLPVTERNNIHILTIQASPYEARDRAPPHAPRNVDGSDIPRALN